MSSRCATTDGIAPPAGPPARWFHRALQAPPQAVPDNLHGILAGGSRGRLRALALGLRRASGPVLVLAGDAAAGGPPCGIPIRDLDLRASSAACPLQHSAVRSACEHAAGDLAPLVAACWCRIRDCDIPPGCYRALTLHAGPRAAGAEQLTGVLERLGLPAPIAQGGGLLCLVRSLAELRLVAPLGWLPCAPAGAGAQPASRREDGGHGLAQAFAAAGSIQVPALASAIIAALADADPVHGPVAAGRIAAALQGAQPWRAWSTALCVVTASPADADRVALVLECALAEAQARLRRRDAALRTLVVDSDLLVGAAQESGQAIARCGRKANCSCLVLAGSVALPGWRDHAGFTIEEEGGGLWLAIDQEYRIAIDALVPDELIVRAHALLHRPRRAE